MTELDNTQQQTTTLDDPTQNTLADDESISIDWEATEREPGGFKPRIKPGKHNFTFHLEDAKDANPANNSPESPFGYQKNKNTPNGSKGDFVVTHKADIAYTNAMGEEKVATLRFIKASSFRSPNMAAKHMNSALGKLLKALDKHETGIEAIKSAMREMDGSVAPGFIVTGLELYCKECKSAVRTNARKGDVFWPKEKGGWAEYVTCKCGKTSGPGRESVEGYMPPVG